MRWLVGLAFVLATLLVACGGSPDPATDGEPPVAPTDVRSEAGAGFVVVTWEHDGVDVGSFRITRSEVAVPAAAGKRTAPQRSAEPSGEIRRYRVHGASGTQPAPTLSTAATEVGSAPEEARSFVDDGVEPGVAYRYAVSAVNPSGVASAPVDQDEESVSARPEGGEAAENPDPSRYLTVRVLDEAGNALPDARVTFLGAREGDTWHSSFRGETGADGVAILADANGESYDEPGTYSGYLWVDPAWNAGVRQQLVAVDALSFPGTFTADPRSEALEDLRFVITGREADADYDVQLAVPIGDRTVLGKAFNVNAGTSDVLVVPGDYPLAITGDSGRSEGGTGDAVHLWDQVSVPGTPRFEFDTTQVETSSLTATFTLAEPGTTDWNGMCPRAQDDAVHHWNSYCLRIDGPARFTPKEYEIGFFANAVDTDGTEWWYDFDRVRVDLRPAGSAVELAYGGALTLTYAPAATSYAPGETVAFDGSLVDGGGHELWFIDTETGDGWTGAPATVTVTGPSGEIVAEVVLEFSDLFDRPDNAVTLAATAPTGTYGYEVAIDTGPLDGVKTVSGTFDVGTE